MYAIRSYYVKSIGFDMLPQSVTDNLINQINIDQWLKNKLWIVGNINLKEWELWTNADNNEWNIANQEKVSFAKMFNIILSCRITSYNVCYTKLLRYW